MTRLYDHVPTSFLPQPWRAAAILGLPLSKELLCAAGSDPPPRPAHSPRSCRARGKWGSAMGGGGSPGRRSFGFGEHRCQFGGRGAFRCYAHIAAGSRFLRSLTWASSSPAWGLCRTGLPVVEFKLYHYGHDSGGFGVAVRYRYFDCLWNLSVEGLRRLAWSGDGL